MTNPIVVMGTLIDATKVSFVGDPVKMDRDKLDSPYLMQVIVDGCMIDLRASGDQCKIARAELIAAMGVVL